MDILKSIYLHIKIKSERARIKNITHGKIKIITKKEKLTGYDSFLTLQSSIKDKTQRFVLFKLWAVYWGDKIKKVSKFTYLGSLEQTAEKFDNEIW